MSRDPCMHDNAGKRVDKWLPHMQSSRFLWLQFGLGNRSNECWAELRTRKRRVAAAQAVLPATPSTGEPT